MWEREFRGFEIYLKLERSLSDNTLESYQRDVRTFCNFLINNKIEKAVIDVKEDDVRAFSMQLAKLEMSEYTQARMLSGLRAFFNYLVLEDVIKVNPCDKIEQPKLPKKLPDTLSVPEIEVILEGFQLGTRDGLRNRTILETLYSSGIRVSELVNLKITGIYWNDGFMKVIGKGDKERLVPVGSHALKYLDMYINQVRNHAKIEKGFENFVFLNNRGKNLSRVMIFLIIKEAVKNCGLEKNVSPHTFRHSFATHLIEGGADLRAVQEMLGHESIITTEIYTHLDRDYLRQVVIDCHPRSKKK